MHFVISLAGFLVITFGTLGSFASTGTDAIRWAVFAVLGAVVLFGSEIHAMLGRIYNRDDVRESVNRLRDKP